MMNFAQPKAIEEALSLLANERWSILSGGTDFYPALGDKPPQGNILDLSRLHTLNQITQDNDYWIIGARVTWSDIIQADLPVAFDALKLAAREVGSIQIQNRATLAGNLCNASPAADGMPPLLCLDTQVKLASIRGERTVALSDFIRGNRETALADDEILTHLLIPKAATCGHSAFLKLGARKYLVISISMIAARLHWNEAGIIKDAAISIGSCSLVAQRLKTLESDLIGQQRSVAINQFVRAEHLDCLSPIDDVRATANYRLDASLTMVRRTLQQVMQS
ncbi:MAG: FAD binding domain-containing protein [Thiolinea sp.]